MPPKPNAKVNAVVLIQQLSRGKLARKALRRQIEVR
jgi:hypothetical protein